MLQLGMAKSFVSFGIVSVLLFILWWVGFNSLTSRLGSLAEDDIQYFGWQLWMRVYEHSKRRLNKLCDFQYMYFLDFYWLSTENINKLLKICLWIENTEMLYCTTFQNSRKYMTKILCKYFITFWIFLFELEILKYVCYCTICMK